MLDFVGALAAHPVEVVAGPSMLIPAVAAGEAVARSWGARPSPT